MLVVIIKGHGHTYIYKHFGKYIEKRKYFKNNIGRTIQAKLNRNHVGFT